MTVQSQDRSSASIASSRPHPVPSISSSIAPSSSDNTMSSSWSAATLNPAPKSLTGDRVLAKLASSFSSPVSFSPALLLFCCLRASPTSSLASALAFSRFLVARRCASSSPAALTLPTLLGAGMCARSACFCSLSRCRTAARCCVCSSRRSRRPSRPHSPSPFHLLTLF